MLKYKIYFSKIQHIEIFFSKKGLYYYILYSGEHCYMELSQAVARRIRRLLKEHHFTQYSLFKKSAVPCSTISMICTCKVKDIRLGTLLNLCRGFDITLQEFFSDELFAVENLSDNVV